MKILSKEDLNEFLNDPLYNRVVNATTVEEVNKNLKTLLSIRGSTAHENIRNIAFTISESRK